MDIYKTIAIPKRLHGFLAKHIALDPEKVTHDALLYLSETSLVIKTLANPVHMPLLTELHQYRTQSSDPASLADTVLFQAAKIAATRNCKILVTPLKDYCLTTCTRTRLGIRLPKPITQAIEVARGETNLNSFATQAIFEKLTALINGGNAMQTQYIPATPEIKITDLEKELARLKQRVTRMELSQRPPSETLERIGEVLLQLIEVAAHDPHPKREVNHVHD